MVRSPLQQTTTLGKTIIRAPLIVQGILLCQICLHATTNKLHILLVLKALCVAVVLFLLVFFYCLSGQGQQVVTQIIRGTPVSKAVSSNTPGQVVGSPSLPSTPGQPQTPHAPSTARPQQGQVKLTLAQLTQLTQGAQVCTYLCACTCFSSFRVMSKGDNPTLEATLKIHFFQYSLRVGINQSHTHTHTFNPCPLTPFWSCPWWWRGFNGRD